ncbi:MULTISPECIES: GlxA family transcriptional regulator [Pseudomonas]|uniref:AraC family transcriptional regulator n=1 Tax=Pseudomonas putida (strain DOT-T1E) TaxID=1196325 RepID=I7C1C9_PSEPT|nr:MULTISPECIES: GlxA family transcriptional regulator [Pseudomonas]AFO50212.1 AraC family transcriptional regulator [Pseudomonas putida DOT-T1E]MBX6692259.1 GlxA family transcriptional regulator [Pseudomonas sp. USTB-Z]POA86030.1 GlxA family transcriptional regulator [Pseudomonas sp. FW305-E2]UZM96768.1 GlxA family transcriptional regulator [Pseudomonas putida DOT-T1E]WPO32981.1 GlxA family transcriptional regulator [Pseudomonas sp. BO3-4]
MQEKPAHRTVAMVLFNDVLLLDVTGPMDAFAIANRFLPAERQYRLLTLAEGQAVVRGSCGMKVVADQRLEDLPEAVDLLLVPGGPGAYDTALPGIERWLPKAVRQAKRFGAICTGVFLLGRAGLLNGYRCTTHWNYVERLAQAFPEAKVETEQIYVMDRCLITSGGITAGIDLALAVVAEDHGKALALEVAKVLLVARHRQGGQTPYGPLLAAVPRDDSPIARVQAYIVDHIEQAFTVQKMAELVAMSGRNFARTFQREVGITPLQYLQNARIDRARKLLECGDLPMKVVAAQCGFGSDRHMRKVFFERIGMTPAQYRAQFGGGEQSD